MNIPLDAKVKVISALAKDFVDEVVSCSCDVLPNEKTYTITSSDDGCMAKQAARKAAFESFGVISPIVKLAFDTRRIDQEVTRNPRSNLQYFHRHDQFIDEGDSKKLKTFAKFARVLGDLKNKYEKSPEWFNSYARQLYDQVGRVLRVKEADLDIFRPHLNYLEQLIYARYRLAMEQAENMPEKQISNIILSKDEELIGRNNYLKETQSAENVEAKKIVIDGSSKTTQESIVSALFGGDSLRKDGEKSVTRTITITINDSVS
jgi:hypothetical protein